jgi:electron transfer flavoprotein-quinone oxidoreductase
LGQDTSVDSDIILKIASARTKTGEALYYSFTTAARNANNHMKNYRFNVIIVGAGPAGVSAAAGLSGSGLSIALIEGGAYAGAENWSGCVYFAESLADPSCFGPEAVEAAPFERRVVRRGTLMHNGLDVVGAEFTDPAVFKNCYTVLRPIYDPYFARLAQVKGAVLLTETTVTSLVRRNNRVIGVETDRGPLHADVVFIAEGDASHLVHAERLERTPRPHFMQGVKATLSLDAAGIEKRFNLRTGEGAAYELLIRNASAGGRSMQLNAGAFLYTNRNSLSFGYVVPLDNLRKNYRGNHDALFEWMRGLPFVRELIADAPVSAYGTKLIRSGGWNERPVLVQDGLAVGGAATGLGVDIPFPNFTGPATASGLYFARAMRAIFSQGLSPDAKTLEREYVEPLRQSVYGKNARYLDRWPHYFGSSRALFSRTTDIACGSAHFLSTRSWSRTGQLLRSHLLSVRGLKESIGDPLAALKALKLRTTVAATLLNPVTIAHWCMNLVRQADTQDTRLRIVLRIENADIDPTKLPWPFNSLLRRVSPGLARAIAIVYANDGVPSQKKFSSAIKIMIRAIDLRDIVLLPLSGIVLLFFAGTTALRDAFRFYLLKTPVEILLAEPVMAYQEKQRTARDLDAVRPIITLEAKLGLNTYEPDEQSHIRTLWPEEVRSHPDMAHVALWWVCPARVYAYDAPLAGRGKVTVNFENCIKCESCWRAEPHRVLWGRHTQHRLIYRPESAAIATLLTSLDQPATVQPQPPTIMELPALRVNEITARAAKEALQASRAFQKSLALLPASADKGRRAWPLALGSRLGQKLQKLEATMHADTDASLTQDLSAIRTTLATALEQGRLIPAGYLCRNLDDLLTPLAGDNSTNTDDGMAEDSGHLSYEALADIFPAREQKQWEDAPLPESYAQTLRNLINENRGRPLNLVRCLSSINPSLGLIAAHHLTAMHVLEHADAFAEPGICAATGDMISTHANNGATLLTGSISFVPCAATDALLVIAKNKAYRVPLSTPGVRVEPAPAIGFRAAKLATVTLQDCAPTGEFKVSAQHPLFSSALYLAISLGAADYLAQRAKEHATSRIQFPGQMLDTEGRDGIAKLGAVKALIARIEAWRLLLEVQYETALLALDETTSSQQGHDSQFATIAALAFGPDPGRLGYDAGQVFGGFAYSEDDLLSRFYRDSALFGYLAPGCGAAERVVGTTRSAIDPLEGFTDIDREPLAKTSTSLRELARRYATLFAGADANLVGQALAFIRGIRSALERVERGLDQGQSNEAEAAACETLIGMAASLLDRCQESSGIGKVSPAAEIGRAHV